jgi:hypothetical protein
MTKPCARLAGLLLLSMICARGAIGSDDSRLCPQAAITSSDAPVYLMFDESYTLYTLNTTQDANYNYIVTRRDVTSAELASLCAIGIDVRALPDATQEPYFPVTVEFYNATLDHYFVTANAREITDLDTGVHKGWTRTGQQFQVYVQDPTPSSGQFPLASVCRYYGLPAFGLDTHFYSAFTVECDAVATNWPNQWDLEAPDAFGVHLPDPSTGACPQDTSPLYRLFNDRADVNHRYTTQLSIREQMIQRSWIPEGFGSLGIAMCVRPVRGG